MSAAETIQVDLEVAQVEAQRRAMWRLGYRPVAVYNAVPGDPDTGKRPVGNDWQERACFDPPEAAVRAPDPRALSTGLLSAGLRPIDVDVDDPDAAKQVRELAEKIFGPTLVRFREGSSRVLLLYRAAVGEPKKRDVTAPTHTKAHGRKVEVLGHGQHFVAFGRHASGAPIEWEPMGPNGQPAGPDVYPREYLPVVTEEQITTFLVAAAAIIGAPTPVATGLVADTAQGAPSPAELLAVDPEALAAIVEQLPNDARFQDRTPWLGLAHALKAAFANDLWRGKELWLEHASKVPQGKPDEPERVWDTLEGPHLGGEEYLLKLARAASIDISAYPVKLMFATAEESHAAFAAVPLTLADSTSKSTPPAISVRRRLRTLTGAELLRTEFPPRELILAPWLPMKGLAMIYAPRGLGKTHLALGIAYAAATGGCFLGWRAPRPFRVVLVDGEMPTVMLKQRFDTLTKATGGSMPSEDFLTYVPIDLQDGGFDLASVASQRELDDVLGDADLIIIDNLSTLIAAGKENEGESWLPVQQWALRMRREGRSVLFIHHAGKGGTQRGTSRKEDVLDTVLALRPPADYQPKQGARFEIHFEKSRGFFGQEAAPFEAALGTDGVWTMRSVENPEMGRVVALRNEGGSLRDVAQATGLSKDKVLRLERKASRAAAKAAISRQVVIEDGWAAAGGISGND